MLEPIGGHLASVRPCKEVPMRGCRPKPGFACRLNLFAAQAEQGGAAAAAITLPTVHGN